MYENFIARSDDTKLSINGLILWCYTLQEFVWEDNINVILNISNLHCGSTYIPGHFLNRIV